MSTPSTKSESGMLPGTDSDENALRVACVTGGVCAVLIVVATVYLNMYADQRVMLTTVGVFSDWRSLRNIFVETVSYEPHFNLPELDYYSDFETAVSSLSVLRDLYQRKLISQGMFANASLLFNLTTGARIVGGGDPARLMQLIAAFFSKFTANSTLPPRVYEIVTAAASPQDQRILSRLMSVSGCSYPDAMPGKTPWNRSPGCHCIGDAYVSFVKATWNTSRNVTVGARDAAADDVLRCLDRRVTSHSWVAGADWTIHPLAVVLFLNCVVFLVCVAFVLTYHAAQMPEHVISDPVWRLRAVKGLLLLITGAFALLFALHDLMANIFLLVGLSLTLGSLTISAQSVLFQFIATAGVRSPGRCTAHPLLVCFWLNVPQIVPALVVLVAVSGYTRDVYAVWAVAGIGAIMGSLLQVLARRARAPLPGPPLTPPPFSVLFVVVHGRDCSGSCGTATTA
jgi:hypothetical protein